jgi:hypothetical protein
MLRRLSLAAALGAALLHPPRAAAQIQGVDSMFVRGAYTFAFRVPTCPCAARRDTLGGDSIAFPVDSAHAFATQTQGFLAPGDTACLRSRRDVYLLRIVGYRRTGGLRGEFTGVLLADTSSFPVTGQIEVAATGPLPRRSAWLRFTATTTRARQPRDIFDAALAARRGAAEFTGSFIPLPLGGASAAGTLVAHQPLGGAVPEQPIPLMGCGGIEAALRLLR